MLVITAAVGGLLVLGLTAASSEVYEAVAEKNGVAGLDQPALDQAIPWRTPLIDQLVTWFTNLGGAIGMTIIAGAITILMVWRLRSRTPLILMAHRGRRITDLHSRRQGDRPPGPTTLELRHPARTSTPSRFRPATP